MDDKYDEGSLICKALGDPRRAMIVDMLSCGELCACKILEKLEMSQSTLSHHMKLLCQSGLVKAREEGKWTYYSLDSETIAKTAVFFRAITTASEKCICNGCDGCCDQEKTKQG